MQITSISVREPIAQLILSNTARAGVTGFLKTLSREVAADGVTVNSLQPGLHATDGLHSVYGDDLSGLAETVPAQQIGDPVDFGALAAFLCWEHAKFITGDAIPRGRRRRPRRRSARQPVPDWSSKAAQHSKRSPPSTPSHSTRPALSPATNPFGSAIDPDWRPAGAVGSWG